MPGKEWIKQGFKNILKKKAYNVWWMKKMVQWMKNSFSSFKSV